MDRSFLSQPAVIAASRQFVCVRLTTYEDEAEAKFSKTVFSPGGGEPQNTTFALLAPDGRTKLTRAGRGARGIFSDAADMARQMTTVAAKYPVDPKVNEVVPPLPVTLTAKLGVDVAAADGLLLVAVLATDGKARIDLSATIAKLAWGETLLGQFTYCTAKSADEFPKLDGLKAADGVVIVAPDTFGMSGKVVAQLPADATSEVIRKALTAALASHAKAAKSQREHRNQGIELGAYWVPKLPVTDKQEENARAGAKRAIDAKKK